MDYDQFVFSQLFMIIFKGDVDHMAYDEVHPVLSEVWNHWLLTDALYGRPDHESGYDAMERYLKEHNSGISMILDK